MADGSLIKAHLTFETAFVRYFYTKAPNVWGKAHLKREGVPDVELYGGHFFQELSPDGRHVRFDDHHCRKFPKRGDKVLVVITEHKGGLAVSAWALAKLNGHLVPER